MTPAQYACLQDGPHGMFSHPVGVHPRGSSGGSGSSRKCSSSDSCSDYPAGVGSPRNQTTADGGPAGVSPHGTGLPRTEDQLESVPHGIGLPWMKVQLESVPHRTGLPWSSWSQFPGDRTTTDRHSGHVFSGNGSSKSDGSAGSSSLGDWTAANQTSYRWATQGQDHANSGNRFYQHAFQDLGLYCSIPAKDVDQSSIHHQPLAAGRYSVSTGHWQDAGHHSVYGTIGSHGGPAKIGIRHQKIGLRELQYQIGSSTTCPGGCRKRYLNCYLKVQDTDFTLFTDVSTHGWGAQLGDNSISGLWSEVLHQNNINILEMEVVYCGVCGLLNRLHSHVV